jgi:hypothetical protein
VSENNHIYAEYPPFENAITAYDGYFQSEKYFINAKDEIIDIFSPPTEFIYKAKKYIQIYSLIIHYLYKCAEVYLYQ